MNHFNNMGLELADGLLETHDYQAAIPYELA
jgi:hypothetical protein